LRPAAQAVKNGFQIISALKGQGRSRSSGTSHRINVAAIAICLQGFDAERSLQYRSARFKGQGRSRS
jgi:hypothetical protein